MNQLKLIGMIFGVVVLSIIGSIAGMFIGAIIFPMKILDGNTKLPNIREILSSTDPSKDQI